jgi:predicted small secreted protein
MNKSVMLVMLISLMLAACNAFQGPVDIQVLRESRPVESAKELSVDIKYDVGQLEITKTSDDLFAFDLEYDRNHYDRNSLLMPVRGHLCVWS